MLNIYGTPLSSPTNKVRYVAHHLKIPFQFHHVNLGLGEQRHPDFLKINPYGRVPVIENQGFILAESNAIIRYLSNIKDSTLYSQDVAMRAKIDQWMDFSSIHVGLATSRIMFNTYFYKLLQLPKDDRALQDGYKYLSEYLPIVENQFRENSYITGENLSLADFVLLSALDVCDLIQVDLTAYPHLYQWQKNLMHEKFYKECHDSYKQTFNQILNQSVSA
jgi:glutathione S-transferase